MNTLSHIIAPTDFSGPSRHAVECAARLAREQGARLHLLHVVHAGALERLRALLCVLLAAGLFAAGPGGDSLRTGQALFALIGSLWMTRALHLSATA